MSTINPTCVNVAQRPADVVCKFNETLKKQKSDTWSVINSSSTMIECYEMVRGYKLCCFNLTEETYQYYRDVENCELFDMVKSTEIIQTNIEGYIKKNTELSTGIKDGSKMLNDLKAKLQEANNVACAMRNCLKSILGFTDDDVPEQISKVTDIAKSLSEDGQKAAEALVKIAGIHTFSDVGGLKEFSTKLTECMKQLKTKTEENHKKAAEELKTAQSELTTSINELNTAEFKYFEENGKLNALILCCEFICEGACEHIDIVEDICKEFTCPPTEPSPVPPPKPKGGKYAKDDRD